MKEIKTEQFLDAVYGNAGGYRVIFTKPENNQFFKTNTEALKYAAQKSSERKDVYFSVHLFSNDSNRKKENAIGCRALALDIDAKNYAGSLGDAEKAINDFIEKSGLPEPTRVCSGNGYHLWWFFSQTVSESEWQEKAEQLKALYKHHGLKADDSVTMDTARVLRLPGSVNYKDADNPKDCALLSDDIRTYDVAEIKRALDNAASKIPNPRDIFGDSSVNDLFAGGIEFDATQEEKQETIQLCLEHFSQERCDDNFLWYEVGQAIFNEIEDKAVGFDLWNEWSKKSNKYDAGYISQRWNAMSERLGGEKLNLGNL